MELLRVRDAIRILSISYPTLKQWIYQGKIRSVQTAGGHHRIPREEIDRLVPQSTDRPAKRGRTVPLNSISGRNKLLGTVAEVRFEGLLAQVTIDIGGQLITSIITRSACKELDLRKGTRAYALIKATEVMLIRC